MAGGDELILKVNLQADASALLTTPGAGKWYKANGVAASQHLQFNLAENASLEWLPQENILFDGSIVKFSADIQLGKDAKYAGWEILCFGRQAKGETWQTGKLNQKLVIKRADKTIWQESAHLHANDRFFQSSIGLGGNVVSASFVIAAGAVGDLPVAGRPAGGSRVGRVVAGALAQRGSGLDVVVAGAGAAVRGMADCDPCAAADGVYRGRCCVVRALCGVGNPASVAGRLDRQVRDG